MMSEEENKPEASEEATPVEQPVAETESVEETAAEVAEATEAAAETVTEAPAGTEAEAPANAEAEEASADDKAPAGDAEGEADDKPRRKTGKDLLAEGTEVVKVRKVKGSKNIAVGIVNVKATFNNTIVSITDTSGNVISWSSAGRQGFKGSRKSTAYAATLVGQEAARTAMSHGMKEVDVRVQGPGAGRESAVRAIQSSGMTVMSIRDITPVPHNGCRARKRRRV